MLNRIVFWLVLAWHLASLLFGLWLGIFADPTTYASLNKVNTTELAIEPGTFCLIKMISNKVLMSRPGAPTEPEICPNGLIAEAIFISPFTLIAFWVLENLFQWAF